jgi:EAL and modified HD-GYP domain-containing signal transduction protein
MLFSSREGDPRSAMLLSRVAVARSMELLSKALGEDKHHQEQAFMVGMFSLLGVLFGMPLEEVLKPLTISESVQQACCRMTAKWATAVCRIGRARGLRGAGRLPGGAADRSGRL